MSGSSVYSGPGLAATKYMPPVSIGDKTRDVNVFEKFYGKNRQYDQALLNPEGRKTTVAHDLPKAFEGRNELLSDRVNILVGTTNNWYVTRALPFRKTDNMSWSMNTLTFDQHMMTRVPHKATSRLLESRRDTTTGRMVRRGIAYEMECQYMNTAEGQQMYAWHLAQMANAVILTCSVDVIHAFLDCDNHQTEVERQYGIAVASNVERRAKRELMFWAITQKQKNGLEILDALISESMTQWQGEADMWIVPPVLKVYLTLVPNNKTDYLLAGPKGPQSISNFNMDSVDSQWSIAGTTAYISRMWDLNEYFESSLGLQRNLLSRLREIGSYYMMSDACHDESEKYFLHEYSSAHRKIKVYDEKDDDWRWLSLQDGLNSVRWLFDQDGKLADLPDNDVYTQRIDDRNDDFLSRPDPVDKYRRRRVETFGQIPEHRFSTDKQLNLARTLLKYVCNESGCDYKSLHKAITEGEELLDRIFDARYDPAWFFNVFVQNVKSKLGENVSLDSLPLDGHYPSINDLTKLPTKEMRTFLEKTTTFSKRGGAASLVRVLNKNSAGVALSLPEKDIASVVFGRKDDFGDATLADLFTRATSNGASSKGSIVGYGSWAGFLALQEEYLMGGSAGPGQTQNGYSSSDCQKAHEFVTAVKRLTKHLSCVLDNHVYFDKNRTSANFESPSAESTFCEYVLGMTGFTVWIDAGKIAHLRKSDTDRSQAPPTSPQKELRNRIKDEDAQNVNIVALIEWIEKNTRDFEGSEQLSARFGAIFANLESFLYERTIPSVDAFDSILSNVALFDSSTAAKPLRDAFPFNNLTPAMTPVTQTTRAVMLEFIGRFILNVNGDETGDDIDAVDNLGMGSMGASGDTIRRRHERISLLNSFVEDVIRRFGLEKVVDALSNISAQYPLPGFESSSWDDKWEAVFTAAKTKRSATSVTPKRVLDFLKTFSVDVLSKTQSSAAKAECNNFIVRAEQALIDAQARYDEYRARAARAPSSKKRTPMAYMLYGDDIDALDYDVNQGASLYGELIARYGAAKKFAVSSGGLFDSQAQRDSAGRDISKSSADLFCRTDLVLSARQVEQMFEYQKKELASSPSAIPMAIRVSHPCDPSRYLTEDELKSWVKKIKTVNEAASRSSVGQSGVDYKDWELASEHPALFDTRNRRYKDAVQAKYPGGRPAEAYGFDVRRDGGLGGKLNRNMQNRTDSRGLTIGRMGSTTYLDDMREASNRRSMGFYEEDEYYEDDDLYGASTPKSRSSSDYDRESSWNSLGREFGLSASSTTSSSSRSPSFGQDNNNNNNSEGPDETTLVNMLKLNNRTGSRLLRAVGFVFLTSQFNLATLEKFISHDILFPMNFLVLQPHKRYVMLMAIKTKGGWDTGCTWIGNDDFMLGNDPVTKMHFGHYNVYTDSVVYNPKNVYKAYDIFANGVEGDGGGFVPIDPRLYDARNGITGGGSVIFVPLPYEERDLHWIIDASGRFEITDDPVRMRNMLDGATLNASHYSTCNRINQTFRIRRTDEAGSDLIGEIVPRSGTAYTNTVCIQGQQFNWNKATGDYTTKITNKGHWGDFEYPGIRKGRCGELTQWQQGQPVTLV